jgi:hypothetical protein
MAHRIRSALEAEGEASPTLQGLADEIKAWLEGEAPRELSREEQAQQWVRRLRALLMLAPEMGVERLAARALRDQLLHEEELEEVFEAVAGWLEGGGR